MAATPKNPTDRKLNQPADVSERDPGPSGQANSTSGKTPIELGAFFDRVPLPMIIVDRDRRVCRMNRAAAVMSNRSESAAIGLRGGEILRCVNVFDDPGGCGYSDACASCVVRNTVLDTFRSGRDHQSIEAPIPYGVEGREDVMWVFVSTALLELSEGPRVLVCLEDITSSKHLEKDLRAYQKIVSTTDDFISLIDRNYRYCIVNKAYTRLNQLDFDQIVGRTVAELVGEDVFRESVKKRLDLCLSGQKIHYQAWFDYPQIGPRFMDVTYTPYREGTVISGVAVNGRDITDLKRVEDIAKKKGELLNEAQKLSRVGGWEWDAEKQTFNWAEEVYRIHGLVVDTAISSRADNFKNSLTCYAPEDRATLLSAFERCAEKGIPYDLEVPFTKHTGERIWVRTIGKPVRDGRRIVKVSGYIMDITDRKRQELALRDSHREVEIRAEIAQLFLVARQGPLFNDVLTLLRRKFDSQYGYLGYVDNSGDLVCPSMTEDIWSQCRMPEKRWLFPRNCWGGIWGESLVMRSSVLRNENLNPPEGHLPLENALVVPLMVNQELIGQIALANKPQGYQQEDRRRLEAIADFMAPLLKIYLDKEAAQKDLGLHARKLEERNVALKVLLETRDEEKQQQLGRVRANFERLVLPYYEKMMHCRTLEEIQTLLAIVESNTHDCLSPLETGTPKLHRLLTPMESQVADLVKAGKTSKEIAALLTISPRAVYFHRNNIRKKLDLRNTKANLRSLLNSHR